MTLRNDCFALPPGVDWIPVKDALAALEARCVPVTGTEILPLGETAGRVLAAPLIARRGHPPAANSAVDGFGFAASGQHDDGSQSFRLLGGKAAAGRPYREKVEAGCAVQILTGALLPAGVDSVVMREDVEIRDGQIHFDGYLKKAANTRNAGEDTQSGAQLLPARHIITPPDIGLAASVGVAKLEVHRRLRVGVLSTGDELVAPDAAAADHQTFDANRPMLLAMLQRWGVEAVDLGHVGDSDQAVRFALDRAASETDVTLTSGGASASDEDHMSRVLKSGGGLHSWRIALKPGRPLALATWNGTMVIGLPGNPVAAFVCTLIFARPALRALSGAKWTMPQPQICPAAFFKTKKAGRREYLRARCLPDGSVEVFASEGSGRISGLSWANGLVELEEAAREVKPGDLVRYLPFSAFGL